MKMLRKNSCTSQQNISSSPLFLLEVYIAESMRLHAYVPISGDKPCHAWVQCGMGNVPQKLENTRDGICKYNLIHNPAGGTYPVQINEAYSNTKSQPTGTLTTTIVLMVRIRDIFYARTAFHRCSLFKAILVIQRGKFGSGYSEQSRSRSQSV